ncbi:MAG: 3-deoxy-D-manno-octulosonic acid kinase [Granulosicoccus sp.]
MSPRSGASAKKGVTQTVDVGVVTRSQSVPETTYWRFLEKSKPAFDADVFDEHNLAERGLLSGVAKAGRGNTCFFTLAGYELVLRHYRRGGMVQHLSKDRYLYTGLERTRAMQEFSVLLELQKRALPAPRPYACRVTKYISGYGASLITYRLPGQTLAERLAADSVELAHWNSIGSMIGQFHREGLYHADLNAHNILIDSLGRVALIDFDRASFRKDKATAAIGGWRQQNIRRLRRSLLKLSKGRTNERVTEESDNTQNPDAALPTGYEQGYQAMLKSWEILLKD